MSIKMVPPLTFQLMFVNFYIRNFHHTYVLRKPNQNSNGLSTKFKGLNKNVNLLLISAKPIFLINICALNKHKIRKIIVAAQNLSFVF